ncbi:MAG: DNA polymerase III subunit delta' [Thiobacillus sp. 63-78]|uniref:DNA polymerase III subunit delta' n=1 Tax=Thiobacillus sp. 63-78 TaxID=1895859 RepID=UPI00095CEB80|nr:DNA polymerase III subunit delta' [Thiobacillus sp. 63-78]MBN8762894.1 DNA polymerase III subunit delta' [Thiobacillus sp.]MBN8773593.1 DNA polymerase III subunit delta' [Thiobacillus sp.]OJZ16556.1 MAG: DNA polymerase III subunit delta' [Thiobacillus sp. 63-78]
MSAPYPWLEAPWQRLLGSRAHPVQALLLAGPRGTGKGRLARLWAQTLLCEAPQADGMACGQCPACHWFETDAHPDFYLLTLQEKTGKEGEIRMATAIEVDQAREVVDFVQLSTYRAGFRVVLVDPADSLNLAAANALLKVLEEPPLNTVFVLVSDQPRRLLPTLRSRCTRIDIGLPPVDQAAQWLAGQGVADTMNLLALASGTPLEAQRRAEGTGLDERRAVLQSLADPARLDPVTAAERWKTLSPQIWHDVAYKWLGDLLAVRLQGSVLFNRDFTDVLTHLGGRADLAKLLALARTQANEGRTLAHPLNRLLQLEAWLMQYRHVFD